MIDDDSIDNAILAVVPERHSRKVAMVLAKAGDRLGIKPSLEDKKRLVFDDGCDAAMNIGESQFEPIAARIRALVATGPLIGHGNLARWRFSEVSLPGEDNS